MALSISITSNEYNILKYLSGEFHRFLLTHWAMVDWKFDSFVQLRVNCGNGLRALLRSLLFRGLYKNLSGISRSRDWASNRISFMGSKSANFGLVVALTLFNLPHLPDSVLNNSMKKSSELRCRKMEREQMMLLEWHPLKYPRKNFSTLAGSF